mgnify:CR=1 FL=1
MNQEEALRRLQETELEMLRVFKDWCADKDITWFIDSGTVIGAVRHQGFIPWDDDIDVGLPRKDYELLLAESACDFPEGYSIHTSADAGYTSLFAKMYKDGTVFDTANTLYSGCEQAIFIDIFPYDYLPVDKADRKRQKSVCAGCQRMMYLHYLSDIAVPHSGILGACEKFGCKVGHQIAKRALNPVAIQKRFDKAAAYDGETCKTMMSLPWCGYMPELDEDVLLPISQAIFEGLEVPAPHKPVQYMEQLYGDWATLPPVEERHTHLPKRLVFSDGTEWREDQ